MNVMRFIQTVGCVALMGLAVGAWAQFDNAPVQNAILEGIQLSSEPSSEPGEKTNTCYFIFRERPSSFFYDLRPKDKKLVFEFNDVKKGASPIESASSDPITGFKIEEKKVNVNEEIRGLKPEWHYNIVVTFNLSQVPREINVTEEYSVISFTYKWCADASNCEQYIYEDNTKKKVIIATAAGVGGAAAVGVALAIYFGGTTDPEPDPPLSTSDLPVHEPHQ